MPIPRVPPDKTEDTRDKDRKRSEGKPNQRQYRDGKDNNEKRELEIPGTSQPSKSLLGEYKDFYHSKTSSPSDPPETPDSVGNVNVDPELYHIFNDTEAILRLSDDLGSVQQTHNRIHYENLNQQITSQNAETPNRNLPQHHHLISAVNELLASHNELHDPIFKFETTNETAEHNLHLLRKEKYDLQKICNEGKRSILNFGSEFKPVHELDKLFKFHPRWHRLR